MPFTAHENTFSSPNSRQAAIAGEFGCLEHKIKCSHVLAEESQLCYGH